jgi:putative membrane protein
MVMRVANLSEAREGELAREKAADPAVRDFGAAMVTEHSAANSKAESELAKAYITSEDSPLSRQLDAESGTAADRLRNLTGRAFDRAYIDRQVQVHQSLLNLIDTRLKPSAHKTVLKNQLTEMRKAVEQHLTRARQVAAALPR